jgi:uncharacterized protein
MPQFRRSPRLAAATLLVLAAFSPLPRAKESSAEFDVRAHYTKYEFRIPMRDGTKLFTSVYVPKDSSRQYPFLIDRTPYSVAPYGPDRYRKSLGPPGFQQDGFIFVYQDVRGRFLSEGDFQEVTPQRETRSSQKDVDESTDCYDTIEWLLRNVAGNNGKAGLYGISYDGFFAAAGMINSHPALKAASPQAPVTNLYMGDDAYHNGAFMLAANFEFYALFTPRTEIGPPPAVLPRYDYGTTDGYDFFLSMGPLANARRLLPGMTSYWDAQVSHPTYDDFWKARNIASFLKNVKCAVMVVGGWFDAEDLAGPFSVYQSVAQFNPQTPNYLVVGPWFHGGWSRSDGDHLGDVQFGAKTSMEFNSGVLLPFFRQYLKAESGKAESGRALPRVVMFETGTNVWQHYDSWPPGSAETRTFYLGSAGTLGSEPPGDSATEFDEYASDPEHPVPFIDFPATDVPARYMVADQRFAAKRPDVLVYQSAPLDHDLRAAGPVSSRLFVSTSGTDSDFDLKLIDVYPMNYPNPEPNLREVEMGGYQQLVRGEPFRGKFRNGFDHPEPFEPGRPAEVNFSLPDIHHTFRRGHRVMVQIQSSWFPLTDRNPQTFLNIPEARESDFQKASERVYHSKNRPSSIVLRVLP